MADLLRVACVQLNAGSDKAANLEKAETLVARAAATGADVVVLPEKWNAIGGPDVFRANAESVEGGESFQALSRWARQHGVTIVGGSVTERRDGREKLSNSCPVYDPQGELVAVYRKIHMFDVEVGGQVYRESETEEPGDEPVVCDVEGWRVGLTVCYDVRFPELYRIEALEGAELITVPAAFTLFTGKDHWELLVRARAVENQLYLAAANQWGQTAPGKAELRPVDDRRPVGSRARGRTRRGHGRLGRARPGSTRAHPYAAPFACESATARLPLASRRLTHVSGPDEIRPLRAVLFDVDFTLCKPGPLLGPEGYQRAGQRHGLDLEPARYADARAAAIEDLKHHPELEHDEGVWIRFTEDIVRGMGGDGPEVSALAMEIVRAWEHSTNFELYEDAPPVLRELRRHGLKIGLVSNTSRDLERFIDTFSLDVDAWVESGSHGKVKPSPSIFLAVLDQLAVAPGGGGHGRRLGRGRYRRCEVTRDARVPPRPRGAFRGSGRHVARPLCATGGARTRRAVTGVPHRSAPGALNRLA